MVYYVSLECTMIYFALFLGEEYVNSQQLTHVVSFVLFLQINLFILLIKGVVPDVFVPMTHQLTPFDKEMALALGKHDELKSRTSREELVLNTGVARHGDRVSV